MRYVKGMLTISSPHTPLLLFPEQLPIEKALIIMSSIAHPIAFQFLNTKRTRHGRLRENWPFANSQSNSVNRSVHLIKRRLRNRCTFLRLPAASCWLLLATWLCAFNVASMSPGFVMIMQPAGRRYTLTGPTSNHWQFQLRFEQQRRSACHGRALRNCAAPQAPHIDGSNKA